jgi:hypothetical protein
MAAGAGAGETEAGQKRPLSPRGSNRQLPDHTVSRSPRTRSRRCDKHLPIPALHEEARIRTQQQKDAPGGAS